MAATDHPAGLTPWPSTWAFSAATRERRAIRSLGQIAPAVAPNVPALLAELDRARQGRFAM
jgi:hypothetical protein